MSDLPFDYRDRLNLQEQIARIDRSIDEAAKFRAEAGKFNRDAWVLVLTGFLAIIAGLVVRLPEILHAMGVAA